MRALIPCAVAGLILAAPSLRANDSVVVFNEVHYHPADENAQTEWIELRSLQGVDVDMSGWRLAGGVDYTFPAGTVISGRGFLLVAAVPSQLSGALGPWTGRLANGGEEILLLNGNDRVMDSLDYADDGDWPVGADGTGATLARRAQTRADSGPAAWAASNELGGTPGASNFLDDDATPATSTAIAIDSAAWKYRDDDTAPGATWTAVGHDDSGWSTGRALFHRGTATLATPVRPTAQLGGAGEGLLGWWALSETSGSTAANSAPGGTAGTLNGSVGSNIAFVADATRGRVLRVNITAANVNTTGSWVSAGTIPAQTMAGNFTWAFWAKSNEGATNNVIVGNRYNGTGTTDFNPREFIKFTTSAFEWHRDGGGENIDYADITAGAWMHHAVVKTGTQLSYYRNGSLSGSVTITSTPVNPQPFFFGGNGTNESWAGWLDDVAIWNRALPVVAVSGLAAGTYTPATAPTTAGFLDNGPFPVPAAVTFPEVTATPLADDFAGASVDPAKWAVIDQGLENTAPSGVSATQAGGNVTFSGTSTVNYWAGRTLRSAEAFATTGRITAQVDRVSLAGTGTAWRSSLWLWGDADHYLHFSQNVGEGGWTWNANDVGGTGTLGPTGGGNNLGALDFADALTTQARMKLVWLPGTYPGEGTIEIWRDSVLAATHTVTNWPSTVRVLLTGQARAAGDTVTAVFDNASVTTHTAQPLQTPVAAATTHYFRHVFDFSGDPATGGATLWPLQDDGAVYYLNGVEIHRANMPAGTPTHATLASAAVADAFFPKDPVTIPPGVLQAGSNVLAVEVHQAATGGDADMLFGAQLSVSQLPSPPRSDAPALVFSEMSGATAAAGAFSIELANAGATPLNLSGWQLVSSAGTAHTLAGSLAAGARVVLDEATLGFRPAQGEQLAVLNGAQLFDARRVTNQPRALAPDGSWARPATATFGTANVFAFNTDIVINEIMVNAPDSLPEQWIELVNKGAQPVDLSGWHFTDGISYTFPDGTAPLQPGEYALVVWDVPAFEALHPGLPRVFGPFSQNLSGSGERLRLRDANDNLADEVRYATDSPWPLFASGTGSSLELKNPAADNSLGSAWAESDETARGTWQNVTYDFAGTNLESAPTFYAELVFGLLNDGEVLIDDVSLLQNPTGAPIQLIQNGSFTAGLDKWRFPGNHRRSVVVDDPDAPGNKVLKLVAGGSTDHMSNHAETTLKSGSTLLSSLPTGSTYRLSFRARWWRGNNALNSRAYFNRGAVTTLLNRPTSGGTPGAQNSAFAAPASLTLGGASHSPAVPAANEAVTVRIRPTGGATASSLTLVYAVNERAEQSVAMAAAGDGTWTGVIPGQAAAAKAVFRVQATVAGGATAVWPPNGSADRAMVPWDDGQAQLVRVTGARPHNVRIVMTAADTNLLHAANNVMSNDWMPCTIIYDERDVYYLAHVHLKGSEHGRAKDSRAGFQITFAADDLFLGRHDQISVDRSGAGDQFSQKEILVKHTLNRAGGYVVTQDDLIRVIAPRLAHTGPAILTRNKIDGDNFLDGQFENGSDGTFFEYELLYPLTTTDNGTLEGNKLTQDSPGPGGVSVRKLNPGLSKEEYRWFWLIKNNRTRDDYSRLIPALTALGQSGTTFLTQTAPLIDQEEWVHAFAGPVAWAVGDNYAFGSQHNALFYVRPSDGKLLYVPWDMDFSASSGATASVTPNTELNKLIANGALKRAYYGHLLQLCDTAFNPTYLGPWMDHYSLFVNENFRSNFLGFVTQREAHIRSAVASAVPSVPFRITTNSGNDYNEPGSSTTLVGDGWVNVAEIRLVGGQPLAVTWTDQDSWRLVLPVVNGPNVFALEALDSEGNVLGSDTITVTGTGSVVPASAANLVVSELHYHPTDPTPAEVTAGFTSADDFEYIELQNIGASAVSLTGCTFTAGITHAFAANTQIPAGGRLVLPRRAAAFALRHAGVPTAPEYFVAADPTGNQFSNGGETVTLSDALRGLIKSFTYDDAAPWPTAPDGTGPSLTLIAPVTNPDHSDPLSWRSSTAAGGTPGATDAQTFTGDPAADTDGDGLSDLLEFGLGAGQPPSVAVDGATFLVTFERNALAQVTWSVEMSETLAELGLGAWRTAVGAELVAREDLGAGMERLQFRLPATPGTDREFIRLRIALP